MYSAQIKMLDTRKQLQMMARGRALSARRIRFQIASLSARYPHANDIMTSAMSERMPEHPPEMLNEVAASLAMVKFVPSWMVGIPHNSVT